MYGLRYFYPSLSFDGQENDIKYLRFKINII